jgi:hypothetical protein
MFAACACSGTCACDVCLKRVLATCVCNVPHRCKSGGRGRSGEGWRWGGVEVGRGGGGVEVGWGWGEVEVGWGRSGEGWRWGGVEVGWGGVEVGRGGGGERWRCMCHHAPAADFIHRSLQ